MKNDIQLKQDVIDELIWEPSVDETAIGVAVTDGVVTLSGAVGTYAQKHAAMTATERVLGVRALADDLMVKLPSSGMRTDTDIARAAANALQWNVQLPQGITVEVSDGHVRLAGDVEWQFQRTAAEAEVRNLAGVVGVTNLLKVKPKGASPVEVSRKIKDALRRSAEIDADRIVVEAHDGKVTLKGSVRSWTERQDAERAAWSAPGVKNVDDRLTLTLLTSM